MLEKEAKRKRRHRKIRAKVKGSAEKPRLSVFRSANHIYAQLIDDEKGKVLVSANDMQIKKGKKTEKAKEVGKTIAKKALDLSAGRQRNKIERVVFDRGGFDYHGRVRAVAEGAREEGLKF